MLEESKGLMLEQDGSQPQLYFKIIWGVGGGCKNSNSWSSPRSIKSESLGWDLGSEVFS